MTKSGAVCDQIQMPELLGVLFFPFLGHCTVNYKNTFTGLFTNALYNFDFLKYTIHSHSVLCKELTEINWHPFQFFSAEIAQS